MSKMIKKMLLAGLLLIAVVAPVQEVKAMGPLLDFCARVAAVFVGMKVLNFVDKKTNLYANTAVFMYITRKYNPICHAVDFVVSGDPRTETINPM